LESFSQCSLREGEIQNLQWQSMGKVKNENRIDDDMVKDIRGEIKCVCAIRDRLRGAQPDLAK
jgi:hypothetical protein